MKLDFFTISSQLYCILEHYLTMIICPDKGLTFTIALVTC